MPGKNCTQMHCEENDSNKSVGSITIKIENFAQFAKLNDDDVVPKGAAADVSSATETKSEKGEKFNYILSPTIWVRGMPWYVRVDIQHGTNGKPVLEYYLFCAAENVADDFECHINAAFIIHHNRNEHVTRMKKAYTATYMGWGFKNYRSVEELSRENNGYLHNGALIVTVLINADRPRGLRSSKSKDEVLVKKFHAHVEEKHKEIEELRAQIEEVKESNKIGERTQQCEIEWINQSLSRLEDDLAELYKAHSSKSKEEVSFEKFYTHVVEEGKEIQELKEQIDKIKESIGNQYDYECQIEELQNNVCRILTKLADIENAQSSWEETKEEEIEKRLETCAARIYDVVSEKMANELEKFNTLLIKQATASSSSPPQSESSYGEISAYAQDDANDTSDDDMCESVEALDDERDKGDEGENDSVSVNNNSWDLLPNNYKDTWGLDGGW